MLDLICKENTLNKYRSSAIKPSVQDTLNILSFLLVATIPKFPTFCVNHWKSMCVCLSLSLDVNYFWGLEGFVFIKFKVVLGGVKFLVLRAFSKMLNIQLISTL